MRSTSPKASTSRKATRRPDPLRRLWPLELIIFCALSVPIFFASASIIFSYHLNWPLEVLLESYSAILCFGIFYGFYRMAFIALAARLRDQKRRLLAGGILVFFPFLFVVTTFGVVRFLTDFEYQLRMTMALILSCFSAGIAFQVIHVRTKSLLSYPQAPLAFLGGVLSLILSFILLSYQTSYPAFWQSIYILAGPIKELLSLIMFIPVMLISAHLTPTTSYLVMSVLVIIFTLAGLRAVVRAEKTKPTFERRWRIAIGLSIVAYGCYLILPLSRINEPEIDWNVPAIDVAKSIEHTALGDFYYLSKNIERNAGFSPEYFMCDRGGSFVVSQYLSGGMERSSSITIDSDLAAGSIDSDIFRSRSIGTPCTSGEINIPDGFECLNGSAAESFDQGCEMLTYRGQSVFSVNQYAPSGYFVNNILLSRNKQWALIDVGLSNLYLADLRSID